MKEPNMHINQTEQAKQATEKKSATRKTTAAQRPARQLPETEAGVERYAREIERATKKVIAQGAMVPVWIDPVIGKDGEVLSYRLNGVPYHIKTKQVVHVPEALAMVLYDQARRKKLSARSVQEYTAGLGKGLGELK